MWPLYASRNLALLYAAGSYSIFTFACALRQTQYKYAVSSFLLSCKIAGYKQCPLAFV